MSKRPYALESHLAEQKEKNDEYILDGLSFLESKANWDKYKATVKGLQEVIKIHSQKSISAGTIRSRKWALAKLKNLKNERKSCFAVDGTKQSKAIERKEQQDLLRDRVKGLLEQNTIFYEEILQLQDVISRQDTEICVLSKKLELCRESKIQKIK
ncbi:hypothetical protein ACNSN2_11070 [Pseudoalteromonas sp. US3C1013]|uniref:hypothetical protein n=1 Tax=unclassified Pseudoalteromonas TaxID=194690 RepID=UPI003AB13605